MKKDVKKLSLGRETLQRLEEGSLKPLAGGIFPQQPVILTRACAVTFTCYGCLP